jgi:phenylacetate-CoA ligase
MDRLETRPARTREAALFRDLKAILAVAKPRATGLRRLMRGASVTEIKRREDLVRLPVMRRDDLERLRVEEPPFGGFVTARAGLLRHVFPGIVAGHAKDWWGVARALHAAGFERGDLILNAFSYHLSPAGHMIDSGAQALGCGVSPAGSAKIERQRAALEKLRPVAFCGKAAFLDMLLDKAHELGSDVSSIRKALVFGAPLSEYLRSRIEARGVRVHQAYATSSLGLIAYETDDANGIRNDGMVVNEGLILEIVRPGTNELAAEGEVGEIVVTRLNLDNPMLRCSTGDLSAILPGPSLCGRTNMRIKGWLGRVDQAARIADQVLLPSQIIDIGARHESVRRLRLVLRRERSRDALILRAETAREDRQLTAKLGKSLKEITGFDGAVEILPLGTLPDDGKLIVDERSFA